MYRLEPALWEVMCLLCNRYYCQSWHNLSEIFCHNPGLFFVLLSYIVLLGTQFASPLMDSLWLNSAMDYLVTYISFFGCPFYLIL